MEPSDPIAFVRYYNAWRVGGDIDQPEPTKITRMLTELCDHAERMERELEQVKVILADPLAVHLNMMRGTIKWTPANLRSLLGDSHREST